MEPVSLFYFLQDFQKRIFLILRSINWPNSIVWLPLRFEILHDMCIIIACFPICDVINFEINLTQLKLLVQSQQ